MDGDNIILKSLTINIHEQKYTIEQNWFLKKNKLTFKYEFKDVEKCLRDHEVKKKGRKSIFKEEAVVKPGVSVKAKKQLCWCCWWCMCFCAGL